MSVQARPKRHTSDISPISKKAEAFIDDQAPESPAPEEGGTIAKTHRFPKALLARVDAAAKRKNLSRAGWINLRLTEAVEAEERS
jgi:hypothetical protein